MVSCHQMPGVPSDVVSVSVTGEHLVTAHLSGEVRLFSLRGQQLIQTASRRVTEAGDILCVASVDREGDTLCVGTQSGEIIILQLLSNRVSRYSLGQAVSSLAWVSDHLQVCVGGETGAVALVSVLRREFIQILDLGSKVVQIEDIEDTGLLVSCLTHSILINNEKKTFRQLGSKPRHGEFGASGDSRREELGAAGGQVTWAARPGCRVWRVDASSGAVTSTLQFKHILENQDPVKPLLANNVSSPDETKSAIEEHGFSLLKRNSSGVYLTYNLSNIYLLDLDNSEVISWWRTELGSIKEAHIERDIIVTLHDTGSLCFYKIGTCSSQIENIFKDKGTREFENFLHNQGGSQTAEIFLKILSGNVHFESTTVKLSVLDILRGILSLNDIQDSSSILSKSVPCQSILAVSESLRPRKMSEPLMENWISGVNQANINIEENIKNEEEDNLQAEQEDVADADNDLVERRPENDINKTDILNDMITSCQKINDESDDNVTKEISKLSVKLGILLTNHIEENHKEASRLLVNLSTFQNLSIKSAFNKIFSDELFLDLCFNPLKDILPVPQSMNTSFSIKQLVMMFEQKYLDRDYYISSFIPYIYDFLDIPTVLTRLDAFQYLTIKEILNQEAQQRPALTPLTLEQIEESNVYDSVNLLSNYSILSTCDVLR